jgi:hypothetical protein
MFLRTILHTKLIFFSVFGGFEHLYARPIVYKVLFKLILYVLFSLS